MTQVATPGDPGGRETRRRTVLRRAAWTAGALVVAYLLLGFLLVPVIVHRQLVSVVEEQVGRTPTLESVRFNPLLLRLSLAGFALPDEGGARPVIAFEGFVVDVDLPGMLWADLSLDEVRLVRPFVSLVVLESGELNLARLLASDPSGASASPETSSPEAEEGAADDEEPWIVDVDTVRIEAGIVEFTDRTRSSGFDVSLVPIELAVDDFSTRSQGTAPYDLVVQLGEQTEIHWSGELATSPIRSEGRFELDGLPLSLPWSYLRDQLGFEVADGRLGLSVAYALSLEDTLSLALSDGWVRVRDLVVLDPGSEPEEAEVLTLSKLDVTGVAGGVGARGLERLAVSDVSLDGGRLATRIEPDGSLRIQGLLASTGQPPPDLQSPPGAETPPVAETRPSVETAPGAETPTTADTPAHAQGAADVSIAREEEGAAPIVVVDRVSVRNFEIALEDRSLPSPARLRVAPLELEVTGIRSEPGSAFDLSLSATLDGAGEVVVKGPVQLDPLDLRLAVETDGLALAPFAPFLARAARLEIDSGRLASALELVVVDGGGGAGPEVRVRGRVAIDELATRDPRLGEALVGWKSLRLEGLDYGPDRIHLDVLALDAPSVAFVLAEDGGSNVDAVRVGSEGAGPEDAASGKEAAVESTDRDAAGPTISIDRISLDGGEARFVDHRPEPDVSLVLDRLSAEIQGLSSAAPTPAEVEVTGRIDGAAPFRVAGRLQPFRSDAPTNLSLTAKGISLPAFSGYAARFAGYGIDRGKLDVDLDYRLEARALEAANHLVLDRFALGEKAKGSGGSALPLPLAVAVLRDASGRIDLQVPVRGNLDDPSFDVLGVLGKTLVNLVMRAATAPFALIPLPGGGDPSSLAFAPGSERLSGEEAAVLRELAEVLTEKPALVVEVLARADRTRDAAALRASRLDASLKRVVFEDLSQRERGRLPGPDAVELDPDRRLRALETLYVQRLGGLEGPAVAASGGPSDPSEAVPAEARTGARIDALTAALMETVELEEGALAGLARARADHVQAVLLEDGRLAPERVYLRSVEVADTLDEGGGVELSLTTR